MRKGKVQAMTDNREDAFDRAMRNIYKSALTECGYRATRFLHLIDSHGGLLAAKQLLGTPGHPEGLTKLWELQRLDISMEALVLQSRWDGLFSEKELAVARKRLTDLHYL